MRPWPAELVPLRLGSGAADAEELESEDPLELADEPEEVTLDDVVDDDGDSSSAVSGRVVVTVVVTTTSSASVNSHPARATVTVSNPADTPVMPAGRE